MGLDATVGRESFIMQTDRVNEFRLVDKEP